MTIETTDDFSGPYLTNGATVTFPFTFKAIKTTDVAVTIDGAEVEASNYAVTVNSNDGGSVTFLQPPAAGKSLIILMDPDFAQPIGFENGSAWLAEPVNSVADRSAQRDIWLRGRAGRSFSVPVGESGMQLPAATDRANKFMSFLPNGSLLMSEGTGADSGLRTDIASSGGDMVEAGRALTGAPAIILRDRLDMRPVMPDELGADPTGTADSTTALMNAAAMAGTPSGLFQREGNGLVVMRPQGVYMISGSIPVPPGVSLDLNRCILKVNPTALRSDFYSDDGSDSLFMFLMGADENGEQVLQRRQ